MKSTVGRVEIVDERDRARNRKRRDEQSRDGHGIARCEQAESDKQEEQPDQEDQHERLRDVVRLLRLLQPGRAREVAPDLQGARQRRPLLFRLRVKIAQLLLHLIN